MIEDSKFNQEMEEYKKLPILEKKKIAIEKANEVMNMLIDYHNTFSLTDGIVFNKEILDVMNGDISEDDFVEAMYAYLHCIGDASSTTINHKLDEAGYE